MLPILFRLASLLHRDRKAVTALEYGLVSVLVGVVIIGALHTLGTQLTTTFVHVVKSMKAA
jgi:Flp pilus assembly pilin Flp